MTNVWLSRLRFSWTHKTFNRLAVSPRDSSHLLIWDRDGVKRVRRFCPHEGADLLKHHLWRKENLLCSWHGCVVSRRCENVR